MGKCHFLCALWYRHPTPPAAVSPVECGMAPGDGLNPRMMFSTCLLPPPGVHPCSSWALCCCPGGFPCPSLAGPHPRRLALRQLPSCLVGKCQAVRDESGRSGVCQEGPRGVGVLFWQPVLHLDMAKVRPHDKEEQQRIRLPYPHDELLVSGTGLSARR